MKNEKHNLRSTPSSQKETNDNSGDTDKVCSAISFASSTTFIKCKTASTHPEEFDWIDHINEKGEYIAPIDLINELSGSETPTEITEKTSATTETESPEDKPKQPKQTYNLHSSLLPHLYNQFYFYGEAMSLSSYNLYNILKAFLLMYQNPVITHWNNRNKRMDLAKRMGISEKQLLRYANKLIANSLAKDVDRSNSNGKRIDLELMPEKDFLLTYGINPKYVNKIKLNREYLLNKENLFKSLLWSMREQVLRKNERKQNYEISKKQKDQNKIKFNVVSSTFFPNANKPHASHGEEQKEFINIKNSIGNRKIGKLIGVKYGWYSKQKLKAEGKLIVDKRREAIFIEGDVHISDWIKYRSNPDHEYSKTFYFPVVTRANIISVYKRLENEIQFIKQKRKNLCPSTKEYRIKKAKELKEYSQRRAKEEEDQLWWL